MHKIAGLIKTVLLFMTKSAGSVRVPRTIAIDMYDLKNRGNLIYKPFQHK